MATPPLTKESGSRLDTEPTLSPEDMRRILAGLTDSLSSGAISRDEAERIVVAATASL